MWLIHRFSPAGNQRAYEYNAKWRKLIFKYTFIFLRKRTAHAQRNNEADDFHILQLKPISKKSALKPKTQTRKKIKYLTPGKAWELGSENKPVATRATGHRKMSKYIQKCCINIWQFRLLTIISSPSTELQICWSCKPCHWLVQLVLFFIHIDSFHTSFHLSLERLPNICKAILPVEENNSNLFLFLVFFAVY